MMKMSCGKNCEIFSRVVGYHRPIQQWNNGKREEFRHRKTFKEGVSMNSKFATSGKPTAMVQKISTY